MTEKDIKYRQGRSERQWNSNEMIGAWAISGFIVCLLVIELINIFK